MKEIADRMSDRSRIIVVIINADNGSIALECDVISALIERPYGDKVVL
jgi:hypothetical protein